MSSWLARIVVTTKNVERIAAIQSSVIEAFFAAGSLKDGTPSAIASIPVRAAAPEENARSRKKIVTACVPDSKRWSDPPVCMSCPSASRTMPTASMPPKVKMKK